jgi:hypothetical protein
LIIVVNYHEKYGIFTINHIASPLNAPVHLCLSSTIARASPMSTVQYPMRLAMTRFVHSAVLGHFYDGTGK